MIVEYSLSLEYFVRQQTKLSIITNSTWIIYEKKITISIMKKQIDLDVTMDRDKYQNQLADGRKPDDESINSVVALISNRDSQLCSSGKNKQSSFFRT